MATEVEITRKQIIVVGEVGTNSYGDLTWADKDNKPYKVKSTRKQYFECIVPGQAVEICYAKYKGIEYPYSASAIKDKLPAETELPPPSLVKEAVGMGAEIIGSTSDTRLRSMAVSYSKDLAAAGKIELSDILKYADKFLNYILNIK